MTGGRLQRIDGPDWTAERRQREFVEAVFSSYSAEQIRAWIDELTRIADDAEKGQ